jgi:hypothetical protein
VNRKAVVGIIVIILGVAVFGAIFLMVPSEARFAEDDIFDMQVRFRHFSGSNISISFVDDPLLKFRFAYELAPDSGPMTIGTTLGGVAGLVIGFYGDSDNPIRAKYINLTLGSGSHYSITCVGGANSYSITYENNASVSSSSLAVEHVGELGSVVHFTLTEDVYVEDEDMSVVIRGCSVVVLNVDLPDGMNSDFAYGLDSNLIFYTAFGWSLAAGPRYVTDSTDSPLLHLSVSAVTFLAWLSD